MYVLALLADTIHTVFCLLLVGGNPLSFDKENCVSSSESDTFFGCDCITDEYIDVVRLEVIDYLLSAL